ncbi:MAG TPA: hypothetical protein VFP68_21500 [Burkholderiaceae bacterium]|nr:hypothetical protein [Burkholderiaceae bacterium]
MSGLLLVRGREKSVVFMSTGGRMASRICVRSAPLKIARPDADLTFAARRLQRFPRDRIGAAVSAFKKGRQSF